MEINQFNLEKDLTHKRINISIYFDASPNIVWKTWSLREHLDQWWAPKPWKSESKSMDFRNGGSWFYAMVGPDNTRHWAKVEYSNIIENKGFEAKDYFCDESGNPQPDMPQMHWKNIFLSSGSGTKVMVQINFKNESDLVTILEMGFEEGFKAALGNLEQYLAGGKNDIK